MFRESYRKEMDQVLLNEQQKERLTELMTSAPARQTRHAGRTILIAAAVCALFTIAALAASPTLRDILGQSIGSFEPYSQELEGVTVTDQGIQVSVVKALVDGNGGTVYLEIQDLEGDRLTEDTQFFGDSRIYPMAYDPETHTLLADINYFSNDFLDEDGYAAISIQKIWGGVSLTGKGLTLPVQLLEPDNVLETMVLPEDQSIGTSDDRVVLVPEQTPMALEGTDLITLSSVGFDEKGRLHVQIKPAEGVEIPWQSFYADLVSIHQVVEAAGLLEQYPTFSLQGGTHVLEGGRYIDECVKPIVYDFTQPPGVGDTYLPKEIYQGQRIALSGWVGTREPAEGDWTLRFPLEVLPERVIAVNQSVNTKRAETFTITARSAALRSVPENGILGSLSRLILTVYMADGTQVTVPSGRGIHWWKEEEPYNIDAWTFPDPIDPDQVIAFSLDYWYVPLDGDAALPAGWLAELPE